MSIYKQLSKFGIKYLGASRLFKWGFNLTPMYRRSTAKVAFVSQDLKLIRIELPISWKNRNYMNTIFGGSMFSATDPIFMIQLTMILGEEFVVWDKSSEIFFKRPANVDLYADFIFTTEEIETIKSKIEVDKEFVLNKDVQLTNKDKSIIYCQVVKSIYVADKYFYKEKQRLRKSGNI